MNTAPASENGPYSTNHTRPFFYAQPSAQQPFPNPWYLSNVYNPYCVPAPGFRGGNPYFPFYSVALHEYPGYLVPQHSMHARVNRRPYFNVPPPSPLFYHATRFRHYSSPGKKTVTRETQTDPRQPENKTKKHQDLRTETKGCEPGNITCVSSGIGTDTESTSMKQGSPGSSVVVERNFQNKGSSSSAQYRNIPSGSYAFEKEEVRIEYGNGSPAIQLWKSFKETIPLYDVASSKPVPENIVQRDLFSVGSCDGVIYSPREGEELVSCASYSDERKTALSLKRSGEEGQEKDAQNNEIKLDAQKLGNAIQKAKSPLDEAKAMQMAELARTVSNDQLVARQNTLSNRTSLKRSASSKTSEEEANLVHKVQLSPSGTEITNNSNLQQKKVNQSHSTTNESLITMDKSLWCDESVEKYVPSDRWLACVDAMDTNYNYDIPLPQRKRQSVLSLSSDEMSSKDEESSIDDVPMSYFVPDYVLKNMYAFQKRTAGSETEKIKSGGSLNEDEVVGREQTNVVNSQNFKSCSKVKIKKMSSTGRQIGALPRSSSQKKIYSLKKKTKSLSLSEAEDSEENVVAEEGEEEEEEEDPDPDEVEYFFQEAPSCGPWIPGKDGFYQQIGQRVLWQPPKNAIPAQLISLPAREKIKRSEFGESIGLANRSREKEQDEIVYSDYDYGYYGKKRLIAKQEGSDHRTSQKSSRVRLLKENMGMAADEYWIRSGAKPKFVSQINGSLSPPTKSEEQGYLLLDKPKKKRIGKPPYKRRDTRCEAEDIEVWEMAKPSTHKGCGSKRFLYKRR